MSSFEADTAVLLADGTLRAISDVQAGDLVWARDPATGEAGARRVVASVTSSGDRDLVEVEADGETVTATAGHPFWVDDQGRWVHATHLEAGDVLLAADGTTTDIDAVAHRRDTLTVHNLSIEGIHTYHVNIANQYALVHSCAGPSAPTGPPRPEGGSHLRPEPNATGPQSTFRRHGETGQVTHHATWQPQTNPMDPAPWELVQRVDVIGKSHFNKLLGEYVPTPHVQGPGVLGGVRPAQPWEIPGG